MARIRELSNLISGLDLSQPGNPGLARFGFETIIMLISPMTPHIADELWRQLGHTDPVIKTAWPVANAGLLVDESVTIGVQINGKMRATIEMALDADRETVEAAALAEPKVIAQLDGKTPRKIIVVPNRIVNIVA